MINKKKQRLNCIISLWTVRNYMNFLSDTHSVKCNQIGADLLFGEKWNKNIGFRIIANLFLPIIMLFHDIVLLITYSIRLLIYKKKQHNPNLLFVSVHERLFSIGTFAGLINDNSVWFKTELDSDHFVLPNSYTTLTVFDYITFGDIIRSMLQSIRCKWFVIFRWGYDNYMISEKCFKWLLTDMALRRMSPEVELFFCNQKDRLAVLLDKLPNNKKSLVEHGVEYLYAQSDVQKKRKILRYIPEYNFYVVDRTYHFHTLTTVYCFSETDVNAFKCSIVRCNPRFVIIGYNFKPSFKPSKKSVLIISDYFAQYENEKKIVSNMQGIDIDIFIKGHPRNDDALYNDLSSKYHFTFIPGRCKELPDADLVISYDSTLAHEYESAGSKVLYYGMFDISNIRNIVFERLDIN